MNNTTIDSPEVVGSSQTRRDIVNGFVISLGILIVVIILTFISSMFNRMYQACHPRSSPSSDNNRTTATEAGGLDDATLVTFPTLLYSEAKPHKVESTVSGTSSGCSICLVDYKATDMLRLLPECGHMYHLKCIDQWLRLHPTCPICRNSPLTTPHQSFQVDHISRLSVVLH